MAATIDGISRRAARPRPRSGLAGGGVRRLRLPVRHARRAVRHPGGDAGGPGRDGLGGAGRRSTDPTVTLRGARLLPPPVQERIPVWVGGKGGPRLLRARGPPRHGMERRVAGGPGPVRGTHARPSNAACEDVGRDPATFHRSIGLYSLIGEDEAAARAAFERGRAAMPGGAMDADTYEGWCADTLSGTPAQVIERVREFEALGVEEIVVAPWVLPFAIPEPEHVGSVRDIACWRPLAELARGGAGGRAWPCWTRPASRCIGP